MKTLKYDLCKPLNEVKNVTSTVCIWDYRSFLHDGPFGRLQPGTLKKRCPFLEYAILMTLTGGAGRGEFVQADENGLLVYDFAPAVEAIQNTIKQGLKPIIVIGNVPNALSGKQVGKYDSYEWGNRLAPDDFDEYYDYILAFAKCLKANFPVGEIKKWSFRVGTEPDNEHWWTSGEETYMKLYDYTVSALQEGIGKENLTVFSGNLSMFEKFDDFYRHTESGVNFKTHETGTQNDRLSISHYNDCDPASPCEYYDLRNILYLVKKKMNNLAPKSLKGLNIGEGQFILDGQKPSFRLAMAQDASAYSASWTAHMCDALNEYGVEYFANWSYLADWFRTDLEPLPIPAWFPAKFMSEMAGGKRIAAENFELNKTGNTVGGLMARAEDGTVRLMLYNHNITRENTSEEVEIEILGLDKEKEYTAHAEEISEETCFFKSWMDLSGDIPRITKDVDIATVGSVYDSDILSLLSGEGKEKWLSARAEYARLPQTKEYKLPVRDGKMHINMPGHSAVMITIR